MEGKRVFVLRGAPLTVMIL
jgi:hypothetical protein